jgi:hypothetical protein
MPSSTRRSLLAAFGALTAGGVAGCSSVSNDDPPAGSLRFRNDHDLPHDVRIRVTGVGTAPGEEPGSVTGDPTVIPSQRELRASTVVDPGETETYENVFTAEVWYGVRFTVDGEDPEHDAGRTAFHPAPEGDDPGSYLSGRIYESGEFSWVVSTTGNPGPFED